MIDYSQSAQPKPDHAKVKARLKRLQARQDRKVYEAVDLRDGLRCRVCGIFCGQSIHRHHVVYRSQGGKTELSNLISLCVKHHQAIHARQMECPQP